MNPQAQSLQKCSGSCSAAERKMKGITRHSPAILWTLPWSWGFYWCPSVLESGVLLPSLFALGLEENSKAQNHKTGRKGREHTGSSLSQEPFSQYNIQLQQHLKGLCKDSDTMVHTQYHLPITMKWNLTYSSHICALPHSTPCSDGSLWTASLQQPPAAGSPTQAEMLHWAKRERQLWTFKLKVLPMWTSGWKKFPGSAWAMDDSKGLPENVWSVTMQNSQ